MKPFYYLTISFIILLVSCNGKNENNINEKASISVLGDLPENPLLLSPITFSINPNESTISTLYGNKLAFDHAATKADKEYPPGAVLYEVTWKQKADSLWFGANIPDKISKVERIEFNRSSTQKYQLYFGHPLKKKVPVSKPKRIMFIISQQMAFTP
jgi:hypothetical protein